MCLPLGASGADCNKKSISPYLHKPLLPAWHKSVLFRWQRVGNPSCLAEAQRQVRQCYWSSLFLALQSHRTTQHCLHAGGIQWGKKQQNSFKITVFLHEINLFGLGVERHVGHILGGVVRPHLKKEYRLQNVKNLYKFNVTVLYSSQWL